MLGYLDFLFLGYSGRIGRITYWLSYLVLGVVQVAAIFLLIKLAGGTFEKLVALGHGHRELTELPPALANELLMHVIVPLSIVWLIFLWPSYAIATKR